MDTGIAIWLDDSRPNPPGFALWVRSVNALKLALAEHPAITLVSLDHDLMEFTSDGGDGRDAARHILSLAAGGRAFFPCQIHSNNSDHGFTMLGILREAYRTWSKYEPVYWLEGDELSPASKLEW